MTPLQKNALGTTVLSAGATQMIYSNARLRESVVSFKTLERLCLSHERLRAELEEAERLMKPFEKGHIYFDDEFMGRQEERDEMMLNYCDSRERSPKVGDCRRVAKFLSRHERDPANKRKDG